MKKQTLIVILGLAFLLTIVLIILNYLDLLPKKTYTSNDFGIKTITSNIDYDNDGIDDYTDILYGAKNYVNTHPKYKSEYYEGGYPPSGIGVCTDVIWSALMEAGYNLKDLIDLDIKNNLKEYFTITTPDPNIDFRRVKNLNIYFKRNTTNLTLDINDISSWQPGDIVVFTKHIAIVSDKRNKNGIPYIIHHGGLKYEEDALSKYKIIGHYRLKSN